MAREKFHLSASVGRRVLDEVSLSVIASNKKEAIDKAKNILKTFPEETYETSVPYCYVENREFLENEVLDVSIKKGVNEKD